MSETTAAEFLTATLDPGLAWCAALPGWHIPSDDDRARVLMLAITGQESAWSARVQGGNGPAHGFWQFERGGGVKGVLTHPASTKMASAACLSSGIPSNATNAWGLMATVEGDHLATACARLLLWTDPARLPLVGMQDAAWHYYAGLWRPGKPGPDRWPANYDAAVEAVKGTNV